MYTLILFTSLRQFHLFCIHLQLHLFLILHMATLQYQLCNKHTNTTKYLPDEPNLTQKRSQREREREREREC